jgi:hypothetical protein
LDHVRVVYTAVPWRSGDVEGGNDGNARAVDRQWKDMLYDLFWNCIVPIELCSLLFMSHRHYYEQKHMFPFGDFSNHVLTIL